MASFLALAWASMLLALHCNVIEGLLAHVGRQPGFNASGCSESVTIHAYTAVGSVFKNQNLLLVERNTVITTDTKGEYRITNACVGEQITVENTYTGSSPIPMRTSTMVVKPYGQTGKVVLQDLYSWQFELIKVVVKAANGKIPWDTTNSCFFIVTICAKGKDYSSLPQGIKGAVLTSDPAFPAAKASKAYYPSIALDLFTAPNLPWNLLTSTSKDGGVFVPNVPVSSQLYTIGAYLPGYNFSTAYMRCPKPGLVVNAGPCSGPTVL